MAAGVRQQPDVTAVAPPNLGEEPQAPPTYYEQLRNIYNDAVRVAHMKNPDGTRMFEVKEIDDWVRQTASETFKGAHNFRTFRNLAAQLQRLDSEGKRPITEDDMSPLEKGAYARLARVGHGMTFGASDELQGLLAMGGKLTGVVGPGALLRAFVGGEPQQSYGQVYRTARNEQRRYLENAKRYSNSGILNPELWGRIATGTALGGGNPTAGLIRSGAIGGGLSLGSSLAELPEQNLETYKRNVVPLAANTAIGAALGGAPAMFGKRVFALRRPGDLRLEKALEAAGGEEGLGNAIRMTGTPAPMLSELRSTSFGRLGTEIRRTSAEATAAALSRVQAELQSAQMAKQAAGAPWDRLTAPITDPRAGQILAIKPVRSIMDRMIAEEALAPGAPVTGRVLEDIRQELRLAAGRLGKAGRGGSAKRYRGWMKELQEIVDASGEGVRDARRAYGPLSERTARLSDIERSLSREARSSGIPVENRVTAHSEMLQEMGGEPWQRAQRAAKSMVEPLYTPRTLDEHVARLLGRVQRFGPLTTRGPGLLPWYVGLGSAGSSMGATLPQINPFFNQQPQDSVPPQEP